MVCLRTPLGMPLVNDIEGLFGIGKRSWVRLKIKGREGDWVGTEWLCVAVGGGSAQQRLDLIMLKMLV